MRFDGAASRCSINRFEGIARKMANTLLRTGRSGVLNSARDFSCCIVTARRRTLRHQTRACPFTCSGVRTSWRGDEGVSPVIESAATPSSTTRPTTAVHAADHARPGAGRRRPGVHRFTVLAKAHQADIGNSMPTTYHGSAARRLRGRRADISVSQVQQNYETRSMISFACAGCASACPINGGAISSPWSARRASASRKLWRWRELAAKRVEGVGPMARLFRATDDRPPSKRFRRAARAFEHA